MTKPYTKQNIKQHDSIFRVIKYKQQNRKSCKKGGGGYKWKKIL